MISCGEDRGELEFAFAWFFHVTFSFSLIFADAEIFSRFPEELEILVVAWAEITANQIAGILRIPAMTNFHYSLLAKRQKLKKILIFVFLRTLNFEGLLWDSQICKWYDLFFERFGQRFLILSMFFGEAITFKLLSKLKK